jgi:hypothetical protein
MTRIGKILSLAMFSLVFFGTGFVGAGPLTSDVAGSWRLADELSGATCQVSLHGGNAPADLLADAPGCKQVLPAADRVAGWRMLPEGGIELHDTAGARIAVFDVGEVDGLASVEPAGLFLIMTPEHELSLSALIPGAR